MDTLHFKRKWRGSDPRPMGSQEWIKTITFVFIFECMFAGTSHFSYDLFFSNLNAPLFIFIPTLFEPGYFLMFYIGMSLDEHLKINCTENFE